MKKILFSFTLGALSLALIAGCGAKEEGDVTATTPTTSASGDAPKETPTASKMAGGGGRPTPTVKPGVADDMPTKPGEAKPDETKPEDAKPGEKKDDGHTHGPDDGHGH